MIKTPFLFVLSFCFFLSPFLYGESETNPDLYGNFENENSDTYPERPMVVVIPSYNNKEWYIKNLDSVLMQNYSNYRVIYIDDHSSDGTGKAVKQYLKYKNFENNLNISIENNLDLINSVEKRFQVICNEQRVGALANIYYAVHSCKDWEIVVLLDADDWFYHPNVLKQLNEIYSTKDIWFTHGRIIEYPYGHAVYSEPIPDEVVKNRLYRQSKHPTHTRTFYAWLFKKIKLEDFLYEGEFYWMAWDQSIMFPLLEMADERHLWVSEINYVYNMATPLNDNKVNPQFQRYLERIIRAKPPYQRLEDADLPPLDVSW